MGGRNGGLVPEEEKLSYATKTLIGPALAWWKRKQHAQWYDDDPDHTWESFKLEILEEFVKKDPDQSPMCAAHEIYALSNPPIFMAGRKQAIHHHSRQEMEPAVKKKTVKKQGYQTQSHIQKELCNQREKRPELFLRVGNPKLKMKLWHKVCKSHQHHQIKVSPLILKILKFRHVTDVIRGDTLL